jgi:ElaB/YqjD/DUF883 family membrane-anchored ribosome-binding protein
MSKQEIKDHVRNAAGELKTAADCAVSDAREVAKGRLQIVADRGGEYFSQQKEKAREVKDRAETTIKTHPLGATAIAFGVGMVLGRLFAPSATHRVIIEGDIE